jgi:hypothetical protein
VVSKDSTYLVSFDSEPKAKNFVIRLHIELHGDLATLRDGADVIILDASDRGHRERILRLSRESLASHVAYSASETVSLRTRL